MAVGEFTILPTPPHLKHKTQHWKTLNWVTQHWTTQSKETLIRETCYN